VAKGEIMHALLAKSGKRVVVMLSRKPIPPARRKMLAEQLGGGSTKYFPGHCSLEAGATTFVLKAEVAGMSKLVKLALLEQTGLRVNKVKCRGEDGDDDDGDDDEGGAPAAEGAPEQAAAPTVAAAPAQPKPEAKAAAAPAQASDEAGAPEAPATPQQMEVLQDRRRQFKSARAAWVTVKARAEADLEKVKDGVRMAYMADPEQFPKIVAGCKEIDTILDNLDDELRDTLDQYASTPLRNQKKLHELADTAKQTLDRYQRYVANNGVMRAIDEKEFADVTVHAPVLKALADLRKAMV
jgi:pyruvate/2-oxoglutarate dehydrogenase complex dihydrolipoamide acyltransferase (E2) component